MFSKKYFLLGAIFGLILLIVYISTQSDGRLHLIFCNVGQGDAAYLKMPDGHDLLIDGGPNDKVLSCLGKYMPVFDREIDLVMLTHPQKDHMQGLISVLERYKVKYFVIGVEGNNSEGYRKLVNLLQEKKITYKNLYQGDYFNIGKVRFDILWPERQWIAEKFKNQESEIMNYGKAVLGLSTDEDLNDFSYFMHVSYGNFDVLFTGDGDQRIQPEIMNTIELPDVEVLKFPHHGSKTGTLAEFLDKIKAETAVISVGKNPWGHPTKEALKLLNERNIQILRTDLLGNIEVISDGVNWKLDK